MKIKKKQLDSYYTPSALAKHLISFVQQNTVNSAVDFCVGNGDLLKVVAEKFGRAELYGTDISTEVISNLKLKYNDWNLDVCDFKDDDQIDLLSFADELNFDLIVLNPPFTCKGSTVENIVFDNIEFKSSTAMAFVMKSLRYLTDRGGLYAILPISCVFSNKDKQAWTYLQNNYNACVLEEPQKISFSKSCCPNIVLIYAGKYLYKQRQKNTTKHSKKLPIVDIIRGNIQMNKPKDVDIKGNSLLLHTTNVKEGNLCDLLRINSKNHIKCYGVVIPRVCNPNKGKIALIDGRTSYTLSDCIIILKTASREDAQLVKEAILDDWDSFASLYRGTGARYTTLERLKKYFQL